MQVFYPEQQFSLDVALTSIATGMTITGISYKLRQHYQGQVQLPKGIAHRCFYRDIMRRTLPMPSETKVTDTELRLSNVDVTIPSVWVSPCFSSNLIRMYYTFVIVVHVLTPGFFGTVEQVQVEIPIGMANMDQSQWARVHAIQDYRQSLDAPFFFDPLLNEPSTTCEDEAAAAAGLFEVDTGPSPTSTSTDAENNDTLPPPSYASLQQDHQQRLQHQASIMKRKRIEKTRYSSRWVKPDMMPELGQALIVEPVLYDEY